jgi:hypothetical protein
LSSGEWDAWEARAAARLQDGTPLGVHIYAVEYGNQIYRFLRYTVRDRYSTYYPAFSAIKASRNGRSSPGSM